VATLEEEGYQIEEPKAEIKAFASVATPNPQTQLLILFVHTIPHGRGQKAVKERHE